MTFYDATLIFIPRYNYCIDHKWRQISTYKRSYQSIQQSLLIYSQAIQDKNKHHQICTQNYIGHRYRRRSSHRIIYCFYLTYVIYIKHLSRYVRPICLQLPFLRNEIRPNIHFHNDCLFAQMVYQSLQ